jgi:hypothetical protein
MQWIKCNPILQNITMFNCGRVGISIALGAAGNAGVRREELSIVSLELVSLELSHHIRINSGSVAALPQAHP